MAKSHIERAIGRAYERVSRPYGTEIEAGPLLHTAVGFQSPQASFGNNIQSFIFGEPGFCAAIEYGNRHELPVAAGILVNAEGAP